jgi:hypothetical protein
VESENTREFASAFSRDVLKLSEWRQNASLKFPAKSLKNLERVKGIEPSYSAWKAAALPLSYTRARGINYHAVAAASTAMRRTGPLTWADSLPILMFPSTMKGGGPVSYTKRCHLAGIAR